MIGGFGNTIEKVYESLRSSVTNTSEEVDSQKVKDDGNIVIKVVLPILLVIILFFIIRKIVLRKRQ
tara:strand:- start:1965 stop:2162 length:198 start_codon:yes stop_codon:yes gene_type:complete